MRLAVLGVVLMCVLAAVLYVVSRTRPKKANAATLFRQLVLATRDGEVAERLVERQRVRDPNASEVVLVRRALEELRADMRR